MASLIIEFELCEAEKRTPSNASADSIFLLLVDHNYAYWVGGGEAVEGSCAG